MKRISTLLTTIWQDKVLLLSGILALISCFFVPPSFAYLGYIDLPVLCLLLSLMLVVLGLQHAGVFHFLTDSLLQKVTNTRSLSFVLVGVCFFCSMFITNDVALITFVPFAILLLTKTSEQALLIPVVVLQTVAANLGSMFTPIGNPQNLYLFSLANMSVVDFLATMWLPTMLSLLLLVVACFLMPKRAIRTEEQPRKPHGFAVWGILFALCLLAVLQLIPFWFTLLVVVVVTYFCAPTLLKKADYHLLCTFLLLFIFIGNLKNMPAISILLSALVAGQEMTMGILLSQVMSNVPAAMLLSGFTEQIKPLLWGVNFGGLGTLIASMASLISYKLFVAVCPAKGKQYLVVFTVVNLLFLVILWTACPFLTNLV